MLAFEVELNTTEPETESLCREYWAIDAEGEFAVTVSDLAAERHVTSHELARIVRDSSIVKSTDTRCAGCGEPMRFASRAAYLQHRRRSTRYESRPFVCESCTLDKQRVRAQEAAERERGRRDAVAHMFTIAEGGRLDVEELGLQDALGLLSVIRAGAAEDLTEISPAEFWPSPLAPTARLHDDVLKQLYGRHALAVAETSRIDAFDWDRLDPVAFYFSKVSWQISDGACASVPIAAAQNELERRFRERDWPERWHDELQPLWLELALHECLAYLEHGLADHKLEKPIGEKTITVITNALHDFSIGQVYNFIWRAVRDAAAYYMRASVPKRQAANTVVRGIERSAEQALTNGWDVNAFSRDWRAPESVMAQTFSGIATGLGDEYWSATPRNFGAPTLGVAALSQRQ